MNIKNPKYSFLAVIYHRLKKDEVWASMVPFWKENNLD